MHPQKSKHSKKQRELVMNVLPSYRKGRERKGKEAGSESLGKGDFEERGHALEEKREVESLWQSSPEIFSPVTAFKCLWLMKPLGRTGMTTESLEGTVFRQISRFGENVSSICYFPSDSAENNQDIIF